MATERDVDFIFHTLLAKQGFEQDNCAGKDFFLRQLGGLEVPAVEGFNCLDPRFVEHYWGIAVDKNDEFAFEEVRRVQAHQVAR